jgi:hypothetical protein
MLDCRVSAAGCISSTTPTLASAFVARWCAGYKVESADGIFKIHNDAPTPSRLNSGGRCLIIVGTEGGGGPRRASDALPPRSTSRRRRRFTWKPFSRTVGLRRSTARRR